MTRWREDLAQLPENIKKQIADKLFEQKIDAEKKTKKSKYNNTKTEIDGIKFDSLKEAKRYEELKLLEKVGEIRELTVHPAFMLLETFRKHGIIHRAITYTADFTYVTKDGRVLVEDVKAWNKKTCKYILTAEFRLKRKLFEKQYPHLTITLVGEE
jgi:hypothetical protein